MNLSLNPIKQQSFAKAICSDNKLFVSKGKCEVA